MMEYISKVYGVGTIIARYNGEIVVRFNNPPGMSHPGGPQVTPVLHFDEARRIRDFDIEDYIDTLPWSDSATDWEKTLVSGNLRRLFFKLIAADSTLVDNRDDQSPASDVAVVR
jgi:hypothetical protein